MNTAQFSKLIKKLSFWFLTVCLLIGRQDARARMPSSQPDRRS